MSACSELLGRPCDGACERDPQRLCPHTFPPSSEREQTRVKRNVRLDDVALLGELTDLDLRVLDVLVDLEDDHGLRGCMVCSDIAQLVGARGLDVGKSIVALARRGLVAREHTGSTIAWEATDAAHDVLVVAELAGVTERARAQLDQRRALDAVYAERNAVVLAFAHFADELGWTVGQAADPNEPDWPVLMIDTPCGQVSWHFKREEMPPKMPPYPRGWDGHSDKEKYDRLSRLVRGNHFWGAGPVSA